MKNFLLPILPALAFAGLVTTNIALAQTISTVTANVSSNSLVTAIAM